VGGSGNRFLRGPPCSVSILDRCGSMSGRSGGISTALGEHRSPTMHVRGLLMGLGGAPVGLDRSRKRALRGTRGLICALGRPLRHTVRGSGRDQLRFASGCGISSLSRVPRT
jgi:hypothetical protein